MIRFLRSSFVIARRDFAATVLSKAFIFFLLGPLFPLLLGGVFGGIGARVAARTEKPVVAVVASHVDFERLNAARARLADVLVDLAAAAILVMMLALLLMNSVAIFLRNRYEQKW